MKQLAFVLLALCCAALPAAAASPVTDYDAQLVALAKAHQTETLSSKSVERNLRGRSHVGRAARGFLGTSPADQFAKLLDFRTRLVALQPPAGASGTIAWITCCCVRESKAIGADGGAAWLTAQSDRL